MNRKLFKLQVECIIDMDTLKVEDCNISGPDNQIIFLGMIEAARMAIQEIRQKEGKVGHIIQLPGVMSV